MTWLYRGREGGGLDGDGSTTPGVTKYKITAHMTENRQYWKMMVKTGPQTRGDGL